MAPTSPSSAPRLLLALSLSLLLTSAHQLTAPTPPAPSKATAAGISPELVSTLQEALGAIKDVASIVSSFPIVGGVLGGDDLRLSSAINDCLDLLDLSSDELSWSMSAASPSTAGAGAAGRVGTGDAQADLRAWLSGALGNQDTCKDGLDDTDSVLGSLVSTGLQAVTSLLGGGLGQVAAGEEAASSARTSGHRGRGVGQGAHHPHWLGGRERRLLQMRVGPGGMPVDAVVAQDGSGNHTTVQAALDAAPSERDDGRYVIYVKRGVYRETVEVKKKKWNVMLVGDGMGATVISGRLNYVDGYSTFRTATVAVVGKGFIARDMTFENTAGPAKHQAVALRCDSDLSVFYRCAFEGHQDTLYAHSLRQFYRDCNIAGTVDFVFGNAAAVFQNCHLLARAPLPGQKNSVTAQGRFNASMNSGFAFQFCNVSAHDDLLRAQVNQTDKAVATQTFLGRPWKAYSRVVFMQSYIGTVVRPEGWLAWDDNQSTLGTLYYGEYMNTGPGAGIGGRVRWPGYHVTMSPAEASNFTVGQFIEGNMWLPTTGVRFTSGLLAS
ncbi:unnamed protein product [Triticum turgidum subsp. durum]|uniref:Pectinesterase n=1 Tax=Triticum turgidum subsp. durum TaxID=4567 RepID=A0A9R0Y7Z1_TRITD|nr:unnamed protein product [Triticum turgidum subsp. durum]